MSDGSGYLYDPNRDPDEAARQWLAYFASGDAQPGKDAEFRAWLEASSWHSEAYARAERLWQAIPEVDGVEDVLNPARSRDRLRRPAGAFEERPRWDGLLRRGAAAAAAAVLVIAVSAVITLRQPSSNTIAFATAIGEIRSVALPDGSQIVLGGDSAVEARFTREVRELKLLRGEAYFDVVRDGWRTFAVAAGDVRVEVLGTEFEVSILPDAIAVAVASGRVGISDARHRVELAPGERALAHRGAVPIEVGAFDPQDEFAWREGRLMFSNERLADAVAELNRYSTKPIVLAQPELGDIRITTSLRTNQINQMLAGLSATKPVRVAEGPDRILVESR